MNSYFSKWPSDFFCPPLRDAKANQLDRFLSEKPVMIQTVLRTFIFFGALLLAGCAANQLPGFENTYYSYNVPQFLLDRISLEFRKHGLENARIVRDNVGRVCLSGSYRNEDEVDNAFLIVQALVGLKSTSPFYPEDIKIKRWEIEAAKSLSDNAKTVRTATAPPHKRALIIGITTFRDNKFTPIPGEYDAAVAKKAAEKAGYTVTALLGQTATKLNIEAALRKIETDLGPNDSLFIYISSHGMQPLPVAKGGDDRKMSIIAYDSGDQRITEKIEYLINLKDTAVPDSLVQRLAKKPTRNTRIFIDTCFSGDMLNGIPDDSQGYILKTNGGKSERAGIALSSWTSSEFTSKGIRFNSESVPQELAYGINKKQQKNAKQDPADRDRAYTIITATSEGEASLAPLELGTFTLSQDRLLRGSFFTQSFFAYLDDNNGEVEPAFKAAKEFTQKIALLRSKGKLHQVPRSYSSATADQNNL